MLSPSIFHLPLRLSTSFNLQSLSPEHPHLDNDRGGRALGMGGKRAAWAVERTPLKNHGVRQ